MTDYEAEVWAGYVATEQIRLLIEPILERNVGQIGTHSATCHEYHVACLAGLISDLLGERA